MRATGQFLKGCVYVTIIVAVLFLSLQVAPGQWGQILQYAEIGGLVILGLAVFGGIIAWVATNANSNLAKVTLDSNRTIRQISRESKREIDEFINMGVYMFEQGGRLYLDHPEYAKPVDVKRETQLDNEEIKYFLDTQKATEADYYPLD